MNELCEDVGHIDLESRMSRGEEFQSEVRDLATARQCPLEQEDTCSNVPEPKRATGVESVKRNASENDSMYAANILFLCQSSMNKFLKDSYCRNYLLRVITRKSFIRV